jgi:hypothetical protein
MTDHHCGGHGSGCQQNLVKNSPCTYKKYGTEFQTVERSCTYTAWDLRRDLKITKGRWRDVILQIWSRLNPDPSFHLEKVADLGAYVGGLLKSCNNQTFKRPPERAAQRRALARFLRRRAVCEARQEALRKARNDLYMEEQVQKLTGRSSARSA